jgi:hypothetical protein
MLLVPIAKDPIVLTYLTLRKVVGWVAFLLPFALVIPWVLKEHVLASSISAYYYTGMRNLFVGSLCAISMFMLCCRGYDRLDVRAGFFSGLCALGVAFFPTAPESAATQSQHMIGAVHYAFAFSLFSTLAYFCLRLFKMSAQNRQVTRRKLQRNQIYTICGWAIIGSMLMIFCFHYVFKIDRLIGAVSPTLVFESTALLAFGYAWLIKGEAFFKDEIPGASQTQTAGNEVTK